MLYTFIDVETSGLDIKDSILSFAYMLIDENLNLKQSEILYFWKEGVTGWSEEAYAINGLSKEFLRTHEAEYDDNLRKMYIVLSRATVVGYNSGYVNSQGTISGFDIPRCLRLLSINDYPAPQITELIDVMQLIPRMKLQKAFEKYSGNKLLAQSLTALAFPSTGATAHNAGYDVAMTAIVFKALLNKGVLDVSADYNVGSSIMDCPTFKYVTQDGVMAFQNVDTGEITTFLEMREKHKDLYDAIMKNPGDFIKE